MGDEAETSGLGEAGKEDADATQSSHVNEGGKKDPLTRRQELLVHSGLAEVNVFYFLIRISIELFLILSYQACCLAHFTFCDPFLQPLPL